MKNLLLVIVLAAALSFPVHATTVTAPVAPSEIEKYMPDESISFSKDLWYIVRSALGELTPNISEAMEICASVIAIQLLITVLRNFSGISKNAVTLIGITCLSILLLTPSKTMINLGVETVQSISEYNKLLLPIMTAAVAAQGGTATSAALYTGTIVLDAVLTTMIGKILIPLLYGFIAIGIALAAIEGQILKNFLAFIKWIITWLLKISIYIFTGYMGITGVISGTVDSAALKATKLAISGSVPVIGNIISDASEAILVSAGIVKNSAGIYGFLVIFSIWLIPFLKIGVQYLLLKLTSGVSALFAEKNTLSLVEHINTAMGFVLAMTGTTCLLLLISIVCFLKGMNG